MSDTPIYDDLVIEREGRSSDAEIAAVLEQWTADTQEIQ